MKRVVLIIFFLLLIGFVGLQLVPVDRTNPPVISEPEWDSPQTQAYAKRACYDCHSNETNWPWYSYVAPISWQVAEHVHEGREHFNMSEWPSGEGEEAAEELEEGEMPLWDYLLMHPEAQLTEAETAEFVAGLKATFGEEDEEHEESEEYEEHEEDDD